MVTRRELRTGPTGPAGWWKKKVLNRLIPPSVSYS